MKTFLKIVSVIMVWTNFLAPSNIFAQDPVADNMLLFKRDYGGWPKHYHEESINYYRVYSAVEKASITDESNRNDGTIDNDATTKEIRYLLKAYQSTQNKKYIESAEQGIKYLLKAQYKNGGWPQFYPDLSSYRHEITFNDNAMINAMNVLYDLSLGNKYFDVVDASLRKPAADAVKSGINCILKTQIKVRGVLTVWCAQYDEISFQPAKARAYELPSLSGEESVGIVLFLMRLPNPSPEIKKSIQTAVEWFKKSKIIGIDWKTVKDSTAPKGFDKIVVSDPNGEYWARFYEIESNEPFFCGRDGIKRKSVAEIEYERRTGYAWYGKWPKELIEVKYPEWLTKNN